MFTLIAYDESSLVQLFGDVKGTRFLMLVHNCCVDGQELVRNNELIMETTVVAAQGSHGDIDSNEWVPNRSRYRLQ